jgi:hypothetical protein
MNVNVWRSVAVASIALLSIGPSRASGQDADAVDLIVKPGRPLRVALDERVTIKRAGQPITATVIEPVYSYDRVVVPAGTRVLGHVQELVDPTTMARMRSVAGGDLSPNRGVVLQFDTVVLDDGRELPITTVVGHGTERVMLSVAEPTEKEAKTTKPGVSDRARDGVERAKEAAEQAKRDAEQKVRDTLAAIKGPGKKERLKDAIIRRLPYHPQFLTKGTVYSADLLTPLDFGSVARPPSALAGTRPAPASVLTARLVTSVDSLKTPKGTPIKAVIVEPVYSADGQLLLPEGTELAGEVTFAKKALRFHRNGQLRFLFETVQPPGQEASTLLASLYSVQVAQGDGVRLDDEGGAKTTDSKTRFIAPALALLSLRGSIGRDHRAMDNDGDDSLPSPPSGNFGSRGVGGFLGWGLAGAALSQISRPVGVAFAAVGVARTLYSSVFARGRDVSFPADTPIQVQLPPGPKLEP